MNEAEREKQLRTGDYHIDDDFFLTPDEPLGPWQILQAHVRAAADSDNPTIAETLDALCLLVRMVEPERLDVNLTNERLYSGKDYVTRISRTEVHRLVDEVLSEREINGIIALGNFLDVARRKHR